MKALVISLSILSMILLGIVAIGYMETRKESDLQQSEIEGLKKRNKSERDSMETRLALTRDSLFIAFETIRQATKDRELAHERTQKLIRNYEKIIFVTLNDSSRNSELIKLYPSFKPTQK